MGSVERIACILGTTMGPFCGDRPGGDDDVTARIVAPPRRNGLPGALFGRWAWFAISASILAAGCSRSGFPDESSPTDFGQADPGIPHNLNSDGPAAADGIVNGDLPPDGGPTPSDDASTPGDDAPPPGDDAPTPGDDTPPPGDDGPPQVMTFSPARPNPVASHSNAARAHLVTSSVPRR